MDQLLITATENLVAPLTDPDQKHWSYYNTHHQLWEAVTYWAKAGYLDATLIPAEPVVSDYPST